MSQNSNQAMQRLVNLGVRRRGKADWQLDKSRSKPEFTTPYNVLLNIKYHILFSTSYVHLFLIFQYSDIYKAFAQVNTKYEIRTKGNLGGRLKGIRSLGGWA